MAQLLPNGNQQFLDANGNPLVGGLVYFYIPNTTTPKDTWQDAAATILNTNPVVCDARGQATIFGFGQYRQILKDAFGNSVWDKTVGTPAASDVAVTPATNLPETDVQAALARIASEPYGLRNRIINSAFQINQRTYVSGAATTAGQYTLDRWKVTGTGGITFSATAGKTTVTIPAGQTLEQVIEDINLPAGDYVLSWEGTAQGRIDSAAYGASGTVKVTLAGGVNSTIEFNAGTLANVQFEPGSVATPFEYRPADLDELLACRYYEVIRSTVGLYPGGTAYTANNRAASEAPTTAPIHFRCAKRVVPTMSAPSGIGQVRYVCSADVYTGASPTFYGIGVHVFNLSCSSSPVASYGFIDSVGDIFADAEL